MAAKVNDKHEAGMEFLSYDILILGSGAAGLRAAISPPQAGLGVCVASKGAIGKSSCTWLSAGVMAGSIDARTSRAHLDRTLLAGRGTNQPELAQILVEDAPLRLEELTRWGIHAEFKRGYLFSKGRPPVQGMEIVRCLMKRNEELGTQFLGNLLITDLVMQNGNGWVRGYHRRSGKWVLISAKAVIIATGGASALYLRHDNPNRMLGDGYRLALEAGAVLQDMEFVQFYPLCLAGPGTPPLVIPPKLADHGRLVNDSGENILEKYDIQERPAAERARDKLSQALFIEIYQKAETVWLDLRGLSEDDWRNDPFSASVEHILGNQYGARQRAVRVAPAAHHTMGGVRIDGTGATSVQGLFAAGEVTGGLHGANRMGGNALTETQVFGARAGSSAAEWTKARTDRACFSTFEECAPTKRSNGNDKPTATHLLRTLREIMWQYGGIVRNQTGLLRALQAVKAMQDEVAGLPSECEGRELVDALELISATKVANLILLGALKREESRGAHLRDDFPKQDDEKWCGHLQVCLKQGAHMWRFEPAESS